MAGIRPKPRATLAKSLAVLMTKTGFKTPYIAKKSGVDPKTINNMIHGRYDPRLDKVNAVAEVFGLSGWQIIMPGYVEAWIEDGANIERLIKNFSAADETGRHSIMSVADMAARYKPSGSE
jgi:transcriptional regulator with XRE-family HTH domain